MLGAVPRNVRSGGRTTRCLKLPLSLIGPTVHFESRFGGAVLVET